jgi:hypothetical protein
VGLQDELVGTFELVALESCRSDGEITHPCGDHPIGMFVFDSAGRYSVQLPDPARKPDQGNYVAMFGSYVVADDRRTFTLSPHGAADPQLIGTEVLRHVTFDGELAIFNTPSTHVEEFDVTTYITWRRVMSR